jgi:hypothetical protein
VIFALLVACTNIPTSNEAPRLLSVNDAKYEYTFGGYSSWGSAGTAVPGEDLEITVVLEDPEGQHVRVWWPAAPEGWEFDPDGTTGVWHVPEDPGTVGELELLLEDTADDPAVSYFYVAIETSWASDTGW